MIRTFYLVIAVFVFALAGCEQQSQTTSAEVEVTPESSISVETDGEKLSYGIGLNIAANLQQQGFEGMVKENIIQGINDFLDGVEHKVSPEELTAVVERFREQEEAELAKAKVENLEKGVAYLKENGAREEVVTTESGLQYEVISAGTGPSPTADSVVKAHYHGTLIDGSVFDSSVDRKEPMQFAVSQVIPGWTEALQLMKEGGRWRLHVPADLAYGEMSPGPAIPPNSILIFDVELLEIVDSNKGE